MRPQRGKGRDAGARAGGECIRCVVLFGSFSRTFKQRRSSCGQHVLSLCSLWPHADHSEGYIWTDCGCRNVVSYGTSRLKNCSVQMWRGVNVPCWDLGSLSRRSRLSNVKFDLSLLWLWSMTSTGRGQTENVCSHLLCIQHTLYLLGCWR